MLAFQTLTGRRGRALLDATLAPRALGRSATSAPAAEPPKLQITMTHANAYGRQNVHDPFTLSGKTFTRGSGGNEYELTITNIGGEPTSGPVVVEDKFPTGPHGEPWIAPFSNSGSQEQVIGSFWAE